MNAARKIFAIALGVVAFTTSASASADGAAPQAGPRGPSIMILGEDADRDTIPRGNVNFNRIQRAIAEQLLARGFKVYDETATTMDARPRARCGANCPNSSRSPGCRGLRSTSSWYSRCTLRSAT